METVEADGARFTWDPEQRLLRMAFDRPVASGLAARELRPHAERWFQASSPHPVRVLIDCAGLTGTEPEWRAVWASFFTAHRERSRLAWYNAGALIRITVRMFLLATRLREGAAAKEDEAAAWLAREASS